MKDYKVIHTDKNFDVVEVNGQVGLKAKSMSVAIMPFSTDDNGMIDKIGFLKEYNPFRQGDYALTVITGTVESEEEDLYETVVRELKEEGGIEIPKGENGRIIYLGNLYPSKDSDRIYPSFCVDVTHLELGEPSGDGSKKEELSEFRMVPVNDGMNTDETLPNAIFLRLFNYAYSRIAENVQSQGTPEN
jgi:8-oxo-dGTP pyrophosphatase MutT (NUDIX family)